MSKITVLGGSASYVLAKKIAKNLGASYVGAKIREFPDGESKITAKLVQGGSIVVVQSTYPPVDTNLLQTLLLTSMAKEHTDSVTVVIPYLGYARQDKEFLSGEVVTIKVIGDLLASAGAKRVIIVDIHSMTALRQFQIPAINVTAIPDLVKRVRNLKLVEPLVISPDAGGKERAAEFAKLLGVKYAALEKKRDRKTGKVTIVSSKLDLVKGRNLILVDDMISTGTSIIKAIEFLRKKKCKKITVVCTHTVLVGDAEKKIKKAGAFEIIGTNTIPHHGTTVDVSESIAGAIKSAR